MLQRLIYPFILLLMACSSEREAQPSIHRVLTSNQAWDINSASRSMNKPDIQLLCLGGVQYIHLKKSSMGGLAPRFHESQIVACDINAYPDIGSSYIFYKVCHEGTLYYHFFNHKTDALSPAYLPSGLPVSCKKENTL